VVDAGLPGIGHCEATVTVSTSAGKPGSTRCGSPPAAAPVAAGSAADRGLGARTLLVWIVAVAGALAVVAVLVLLVRRRTAPAPVSRGRRR
jgi:hypothetical protein